MLRQVGKHRARLCTPEYHSIAREEREVTWKEVTKESDDIIIFVTVFIHYCDNNLIIVCFNGPAGNEPKESLLNCLAIRVMMVFISFS